MNCMNEPSIKTENLHFLVRLMRANLIAASYTSELFVFLLPGKPTFCCRTDTLPVKINSRQTS